MLAMVKHSCVVLIQFAFLIKGQISDELFESISVNVSLRHKTLLRGDNSYSVVYFISFNDTRYIGRKSLTVSASYQQLATQLSSKNVVDICTDDEKFAFLAINRSSSTIIGGFLILDGHTFMKVECEKLTCRLAKYSNQYIYHSDTSSSTTEQHHLAQRFADYVDHPNVSDPGSNDYFAYPDFTEVQNFTFHVPVLILVDSSAVKRLCGVWTECCSDGVPIKTLCKEIYSYYSSMLEAAKQIFADIDNNQMEIKLYMADVVQIPSYQGVSVFDPFRFHENEVDPHEVLEFTVRLMSSSAFGQEITDKYAVLVVFTAHDLRLGNHNVDGVSKIKSVCTYDAVAVVEEFSPYQSLLTFIHEIAHVLGAGHDGMNRRCATRDERLMATHFTSKKASKNFLFSCCSLRMMFSALKSAWCVSSPPVDAQAHNNTVTKLIGEKMSRDEYCAMVYNASYRSCNGIEECESILCRSPDGYCELDRALQSLNGMSCGKNNETWCMYGKCVEKTLHVFKDEAQSLCNFMSHSTSSLTHKPRSRERKIQWDMLVAVWLCSSVGFVGITLALRKLLLLYVFNNVTNNVIVQEHVI